MSEIILKYTMYYTERFQRCLFIVCTDKLFCFGTCFLVYVY